MNWSDFYLVCFLLGFGLSAVALLAQVLALLVIGKVNVLYLLLGLALLLLGFGKLVWNLPRKYLKPLLLACMIGAFNQLDGINAVIYYTADIFRMAGADLADEPGKGVVLVIRPGMATGRLEVGNDDGAGVGIMVERFDLPVLRIGRVRGEAVLGPQHLPARSVHQQRVLGAGIHRGARRREAERQ